MISLKIVKLPILKLKMTKENYIKILMNTNEFLNFNKIFLFLIYIQLIKRLKK